MTAFSKLLELSRAETEKKSLFSSDGEKVALQVSGIKIPREKERQVGGTGEARCHLKRVIEEKVENDESLVHCG